MVDCGGFENRCTERFRRFESCVLRHFYLAPSPLNFRFLIDYELLETWESGLIQRLAKASYLARGTVSSNLTVSAKKKA